MILCVKSPQLFPVASLPNVIRPLIISGDFFMSLMAAMGRPQLATGPQKCYRNERREREEEKGKAGVNSCSPPLSDNADDGNA